MTRTDSLRSGLQAPASGQRADSAEDARSTDSSLVSRLFELCSQPVDVAWLAAYRVMFGLAIAVSMQRFVAYGWVDELLTAPRFRFHYWGFAWVAPASSGTMHLLFWILAALALAVAAGLAFRVTAPLLALGLTYIQLIDVSTYLNHYYLAGLLAWLFAVSPANRAWSVDAWLRRRSPAQTAAAVVPRAWLILFRVQIAVVYIFAGLAKAQSDWLLHGEPLGIWLGASTSLPILGSLFTIDGVPLVMSWFGFLFDTTIVFWLSWRRSRPWAYAVVIVFHVMTRLLFDIGMFPIIMSISALVFFSPSWPRTLLRRRFVKSPQSSPSRSKASTASTPKRIAFALGALYCVVQILIPLRCHLYGGNVLWHEQGMRFSWRVMIRAKGGSTTFLVHPKAAAAPDKVFQVSPRDYLTPFQENEMASQPDLVLQLAHHIRDDFARRGYGDVEVRAESIVALNGRRGAMIIDPEQDLTTVRDGLGPATWLLPAPPEAPPHIRPVR